jgi:hypothetical protein
MARKRFVTSDMSIDEKLADIAAENPVAALMWPWFITGFDDWGRMEAVPVKIKLSIFPALPYTSDEIAEVIQLYHKHEIAFYYEVDGKPYLAVNPDTWLKYQTYIRKDKLEKQNSKIPEPKNAPWVAENNTADDLATKNVANLQSATINVLSPSPSPSPSPTGNISTSEHGPDTTQSQPDEKTKEPEKPKKTRQIPLFDEATEQYKLAMFMRQCILSNLPKAKVPKPTPEGLRRWTYDIDLMMRIDCRSPDEIRELIDWSHRDPFWKANILSPGKLREKWDTLVAHKQRGEERIRGTPAANSYKSGNPFLELAKEEGLL